MRGRGAGTHDGHGLPSGALEVKLTVSLVSKSLKAPMRVAPPARADPLTPRVRWDLRAARRVISPLSPSDIILRAPGEIASRTLDAPYAWRCSPETPGLSIELHVSTQNPVQIGEYRTFPRVNPDIRLAHHQETEKLQASEVILT